MVISVNHLCNVAGRHSFDRVRAIFFFKYHFNIFYFAHIKITQALKLNFESDFSDFWGDFGDLVVISVISVNRLTGQTTVTEDGCQVPAYPIRSPLRLWLCWVKMLKNVELI